MTRSRPENCAPLPQFADLLGKQVRLLGIGGSGMAGLAALLLRRGVRVSGYDQCPSQKIDELRALGADIFVGDAEAARVAPADYVVASAAIHDDHPEISRARQNKIPILKYAQMLGALTRHFSGVAISGTHGKSTTTAWLTYTCQLAGLDPSFIVGAEVAQLGGGSGAGDGAHFIVEACEYYRSFLHLEPYAATILNVEEDHLDCYANIGEIVEAFCALAARVRADGALLLNADMPHATAIAAAASCHVTTFGFSPRADIRATNVKLENGTYQFDIVERDSPRGRMHLHLAGKHNVANGLAVAGLARKCGVGWADIQKGLETFQGAGRRMQLRLTTEDGIRIIDDYAHHPTEIAATIAAARERYAPHRLWCVFQPHQHSRTRFFLEDFARSFAGADRVIVPDIFFVRDTQRDKESVNAMDLVERVCANGQEAHYIESFGGIASEIIAGIAPGDVVLTLGAGNIWKVADDLVCRLQANLHR
ncbi:MAG: UDP-N-acetylmuramate--L-alanine ligase [Phycisphaerae bacterium]